MLPKDVLTSASGTDFVCKHLRLNHEDGIPMEEELGGGGENSGKARREPSKPEMTMLIHLASIS